MHHIDTVRVLGLISKSGTLSRVLREFGRISEKVINIIVDATTVYANIHKVN
jgi:hypothetical protein